MTGDLRRPASMNGGHKHPLLTVAEAAAMLRCSGMTVRRGIEARELPAVKIGSKAMVPRSFVEGVLARAEAGETVILEEAAADWMSSTAAALEQGAAS